MLQYTSFFLFKQKNSYITLHFREGLYIFTVIQTQMAQFSMTLSVSENYWLTIKTIKGCVWHLNHHDNTTKKLPYLEDTTLWTTPRIVRTDLCPSKSINVPLSLLWTHFLNEMFHFPHLYYLHGYDNGGPNFTLDWGWSNPCTVHNSTEKWNTIAIFPRQWWGKK